MAVRTPTVTPVIGANDLDGYQVIWAGLLNGDTGAPVGSTIGWQAATAISAVGGAIMSGYADKTVQVFGTFGAAGVMAFEGSNDGTNFLPLNDAFNNVLNLTFPVIKEITEVAIQTRPHVTTGDGTTSLTVVVFYRKTR